MSKLKDYIHLEKKETEILLRSIPATVVTLFVVSVICMNLLANKTLLQLEWIALDGGILVSWLSFMCMDIVTKHFGPKASNKISVLVRNKCETNSNNVRKDAMLTLNSVIERHRKTNPLSETEIQIVNTAIKLFLE